MTTRFQHYPLEPKSEQCESAYLILCNAHDASSSFLDIFLTVRTTRNAKGMPTDEEQDLLRAMLIFAAAGLDSMAKQLIVDALPAVIAVEEGATEVFKRHIERRLGAVTQLNHRFLADILGDADPRKKLVQHLITDLTGESLQSTDQLLRVGAYFNIRSLQICENPDRLTKIFRVRNEISHEMDIDFSQSNRSRRPRAKATMVEYANEIFKVAQIFLTEVDAKVTR